MKYTVTAKNWTKQVVLYSFAEMILYTDDPKWQWAVGMSVNRFLKWVETTRTKPNYYGLRWQVEE